MGVRKVAERDEKGSAVTSIHSALGERKEEDGS